MITANLRDKNILTTVECHRLMGRGDFERCLRAGWLEACARMPAGGGYRPRYTRAAVERCEERMAAGEVPVPVPAPAVTGEPGRCV